MALVSKLTVLEKLKTQLADMTFADGVAAGQPLVADVHLYDAVNIDAALLKLLEFSERVAVIVPIAENWRPLARDSGNTLIVERTLTVLLLLTDRDYSGLGAPAFFGDADFPGLSAMSEQVVESLSGPLAELGPKVVCTPVQGESISMAADSKSAVRDGYRLFFEITTGTIRKPLDRGRRASN